MPSDALRHNSLRDGAVTDCVGMGDVRGDYASRYDLRMDLSEHHTVQFSSFRSGRKDVQLTFSLAPVSLKRSDACRIYYPSLGNHDTVSFYRASMMRSEVIGSLAQNVRRPERRDRFSRYSAKLRTVSDELLSNR